MTDQPGAAPAVGASAITNAPLPTDSAAAKAMRADLTGDIEYMKDWTTDKGKWTTLGYLSWVAAGNDPARWGKTEDVSDVYAQAGARGEQLAELHGQCLDQRYDLTEQQKIEIVKRTPVMQWDKDKAERERAKANRDEAWNARLRSGDRVALTELYLWNAIRAAPLAQSVEEVVAWQRKHLGKSA